jgi:hypothetical protein
LANQQSQEISYFPLFAAALQASVDSALFEALGVLRRTAAESPSTLNSNIVAVHLR